MQNHPQSTAGHSTSSSPGKALIADSSEFEETVFRIIASARSEILLEYYIIEADSFGEKLLARIEAAAKSGIKVQAVFDGFGSLDFLNRNHSRLADSSAQIRIYHPLPWSSGFISQWRTLPTAWLKYFLTLNRRNHRKLLIVDNTCVLFGSQNISIQSLEWVESSIQLNLDTAENFQQSFNKVWTAATPLSKPARKSWRQFPGRHFFRKRTKTVLAGDFSILDNTSLRRSRHRTRTILSLLARARNRIWITTPYFYPHRSFLRQIKRAAKRGVDVRFILPRFSDVKFSQWISHALYDELLDAGTKLFQFRDGLLHAKLLVVDEQYILGSGNFNHRSFFQDLELDMLGHDKALLTAIADLQQAYMSRSDCITGIDKVRFPRLKIGLAKLLDPFKQSF